MRIAVLIATISIVFLTEGAFAQSGCFRQSNGFRQCVDDQYAQNLVSENSYLRESNQRLQQQVQELEFKLRHHDRPQDDRVVQWDCTVSGKFEYANYTLTGSGIGSGSTEGQALGIAIKGCEAEIEKAVNKLFASNVPIDFSSCSQPRNQRCGKARVGF